jgi:CubicO group peptidase (beta-lactamase class C family)
VPAKPETVYQSGSVGKQFTSMAIMLLVEEGKLGLEDSLAKHFPGAPKGWKSITVRHLLTHTSGIPDWERKSVLDYRKDYTEEELAKLAMKLPADFAPGTRWSYSNTGYVLLGILIHKVTGKFYGDFLQERVFSPLGMNTARVLSEADIIKNRAAGYELEKGQLRNQSWVAPSHNTADGSISLTVLDLVKWDAALGARKLLKPESYAAMWSPVRLTDGSTFPYGFGWSLHERRGERLVKHDGAWQGFTASIDRYVDKELTVVVLANRAQVRTGSLAASVAGLVDPALARPDVRATVADPDPAMTTAMKSLLESWSQGVAVPRMAPGLKATLSPTAMEKPLRERTAQWLAKARAFTYLAADDVAGRGLERRGQSVSRILYYGLRSDEGDLLYRFFLNAQGDVADFALEVVE